MIYGYIRVSTDKQDCENQKLGIESKASALGLKIDKYIEDAGISGTKEPEQRALGLLMQSVVPGDVVIISELSRFGRRLFMLFRILEFLLKRDVRVYSVKDGYTLDNSIQSKVLAFAFGMAAEIERDMIAQRTKEALCRRKDAGIKLGRQLGSKNSHHKMDGKCEYAKELLFTGVSKRKVSKLLNVSPRTLNRYIGGKMEASLPQM